MASLNDYLKAFQSAYPAKTPFKGQPQEAVDTQGRLQDLNQDRHTDLADALHDGSLTRREYQALQQSMQVRDEDIPAFDQALGQALLAKDEARLRFGASLQGFKATSGRGEIRFFGSVGQPHFRQAELVSGQMRVQLTDRDGPGVASRQDLDLILDGHFQLQAPLPAELPLAGSVTLQTQERRLAATIMGLEIFSLEIQTDARGSALILTPPSQQLLDLAQLVGIKLPTFTSETLGLWLGVDPALIQPDGPQFRLPALAWLQSKYPGGIPAGSSSIQPTALDLSGLRFTGGEIQPNRLTMQLELTGVHLQGGTGTQATETKPGTAMALELDLDLKDLEMGQTSLSTISSGTLRLTHLEQELQRLLQEAGQPYLKDIRVRWEGQALVVSARARQIPASARIPVTAKGTTLTLDLSQLQVLGIPAADAAQRLHQYLANTAPYKTSLQGRTLSLDFDEWVAKQMPALAGNFTVETISFDKGTISLAFGKNDRPADRLAPPKPEPAVFPNHQLTPWLGADPRGQGVAGLTYTFGQPLGRSPVGRILGLDPALGTLPHLSYSYLESTASLSTSIGTDGTWKGDVSTGLRASGAPLGLPVYAQVDPIGLGVQVQGGQANPYLPVKIGVGYDNGRWSAGLGYQHHFVFGGRDSDLFSVQAGLRF